MDVVGFYALHYGLDYIRQSVRSLYPFITKLVVLYTPEPSYGYETDLVCPETEGRLLEAVESVDYNHILTWVKRSYRSEAEHRGALWDYVRPEEAELVITTDADEVWPEQVLLNAITEARKGDVRTYRIPMYHFWRSFNWACTDGYGSVRIVCPSRQSGDQMLSERMYHFGYARSLEDMRYKVTIHGHKHEWRSEWWNRFVNWPLGGNDDLHPVVQGLWKAEPFDKTQLPEHMRTHPYYGREIIA